MGRPGFRARIGPTIGLVALIFGLSACGGSSGGMSTAPTGATSPSAPPAHNQTTARPDAHGATAFQIPGADNSIQDFGHEASPSERRAAGQVVKGYLSARAAGSWARACSYLSPAGRASLRRLAASSKSLRGAGCARVLAALSSGVPRAERREAARARVGALRVGGRRAFALYHGPHHTAWFMPMFREGGAWRLAALAPSELS